MRLNAPVQGLHGNILRYTNSFVTHDAVSAQHEPLFIHGGVPICNFRTNKEYSILQTPRLISHIQTGVIRIRNKVRRTTRAVERRSPIRRDLVIRRSRVSHASLLDPVVKRSSEARRLCPGTSTHVHVKVEGCRCSAVRFRRESCRWQSHAGRELSQQEGRRHKDRSVEKGG